MGLAFLALILFGFWLYFLLRGWSTLEIKMHIGLLIVSILLLVVGIILFLFLMFSATMVEDFSVDVGVEFWIAFLISIVSFAVGFAGIVVSLINIARH